MSTEFNQNFCVAITNMLQKQSILSSDLQHWSGKKNWKHQLFINTLKTNHSTKPYQFYIHQQKERECDETLHDDMV